MSINERILFLRKHLDLSQQEFGERIGLKYGAIGKMEREGGTVIDQNIKMICAAYHINEEWLRDGTGEMEAQPTNLLDTLAERYNLTDEKRALVEAFLELTDEQQEAILAAITAAAEKVRAKRQKTHTNKQAELGLFDELDDRFVASYEPREEKLSASDGDIGESALIVAERRE